MIHFLRFLLSLLVTVLVIMLFNGQLSSVFPSVPALGHILNPSTGVWVNGEKDIHFKDQTLTFDSLDSEVIIVYDQRMVPHIFASNTGDAMFAQGYVEAKDRLFQLQFINRFASGRLSEILGDRVLNLDMQQRRKGMNYAVENSELGWSKHFDKNPEVLQYMKGINTYFSSLNQKDLPVEFKLTGMPVEEWTIQHSARVFKWMSDVLSGYGKDIEFTNLKAMLDEDMYHTLYPEKPQNVDPVIPSEVVYQFEELVIEEGMGWSGTDKTYNATSFPSSPKGTGSNNWAIASTLSSSGAPIYCSDPHLTLTLPSVWYEIGIHTPEYNVYGVTIPGMPGVMMGFNDSIAWGETNVGWDIKDFFEIKWLDKKNLIYELDGKETKADVRLETIKVKGRADVIDTVIYTYWGPIAHTTTDGKDLAMRWLPHDVPESPEYMTFVAGMQARNYDEYLQNTSHYLAPAQNFGFASKNGDIALRVNGKFPAKTFLDGKYIKDGSISSNDWENFIPRIQVPQVLNPKRGFISSANQRSTDDTYPYYYNGKFEHYRNRTLNEALSGKDVFTIDDMKALQFSSFSKKAEESLPLILSILNDQNWDDDKVEYLQTLKNWDLSYKVDSEGASIYEITFHHIYNKTFDEILALKDSIPVVMPEDWALIDIMIHNPEHNIFNVINTDDKETLKDIVISSFIATVDSLSNVVSKFKSIQWGQLRPLQIHHLARIPSFSSLDMPLAGHTDALNATGYASNGPSWRMIVSLEENTKAWGIFPGGQSGNPFSKYYRTSIEKWSKGEYHELKDVKKPEDVDALYTIKLTRK